MKNAKAIVLFIAAAGVGAYLWWRNRHSAATAAPAATTTTTPATTDTSTSTTPAPSTSSAVGGLSIQDFYDQLLALEKKNPEPGSPAANGTSKTAPTPSVGTINQYDPTTFPARAGFNVQVVGQDLKKKGHPPVYGYVKIPDNSGKRTI